MPAFERLHRQHKDAGLVMVAVSLDTDPAKVAPFVREHRLTFTIGLDPGTKVADRYGVRALPSTFVIDPEGHLAALALGPRTWDNDAAHSLIEAMAR
jgi:peroxiredoxin